MAHDVFISYASPDRATAEGICDALESSNISCWFAPRDVQIGKVWVEAIVDAVEASRIFVLVFSSSSNSSPQVYGELERCGSKGIPFFVIRIDDTTPSKVVTFYTSRYQWLDAQTPPLEKHLPKIVATVQQLLAQEAAIEAKKEAEAIREREQEVKEARKAQEAAIKAKKEAEATWEKSRPEAEKNAGVVVVEKEKPGRVQIPELTARPRAKILVKRSLITMVGIILFLIASAGGVYFTFNHLLTSLPTLAIQDVSASDITITGAAITWTTDKPATSQVEYGSTTDYGLATTLDEELVTSHRVELTGLQPNVACYFRVMSKDAGGHEATSDTQQLMTLQPDTTPPMISEVEVISAEYTGDSATITWKTDEDAIGQVEYGTTDAYSKLVATDGEFTTSHSIELTGLQPNTTCHFRVKSRDEEGNEAESGDHAFSTWVAEKNWAEYINEEYGFSVKYPNVWKENKNEEKAPSVFYAAHPAKVPVIRIMAMEAATFADMVKTGLEKAGCTDVKVGAEKEVILADGNTATAAKVNLRSQGYYADSYALGVKKGDKWITVVVSTVASVTPYDEAKFSQIAYTLRFTAE